MAFNDSAFRANDIRAKMDLQRDVRRAQIALTGVAPPSSGYHIQWNDQSLDCLLMVIRLMYSHMLVDDDAQAAIREMESTNPLLTLAWQDFENRGVSLHAAKEAVFAKIQSEHDGSMPRTDFLGLMGCNMMRQWWKDPASQLYFDHPGLSVPDSLLRVDCASEELLSLQDFIDGSFTLEAGTSWKLSAEPVFVRIHYTPGPAGPWVFEDVQQFYMPIARNRGISAMEFCAYRRRYVLAAVVKLGANFGEKDFVRLYESDGSRLAFTSEDSGISNDTWSMLDEGGSSYVLFFTWCPQGPAQFGGMDIDLGLSPAFDEDFSKMLGGYLGDMQSGANQDSTPAAEDNESGAASSRPHSAQPGDGASLSRGTSHVPTGLLESGSSQSATSGSQTGRQDMGVSGPQASQSGGLLRTPPRGPSAEMNPNTQPVMVRRNRGFTPQVFRGSGPQDK